MEHKFGIEEENKVKIDYSCLWKAKRIFEILRVLPFQMILLMVLQFLTDPKPPIQNSGI